MPSICEFKHGLKIVMYYNDHNPPHFHVLKENRNLALVEINSLKVLTAGEDLRSSQIREVVDWARQHRKELSETWETLQPRRQQEAQNEPYSDTRIFKIGDRAKGAQRA